MIANLTLAAASAVVPGPEALLLWQRRANTQQHIDWAAMGIVAFVVAGSRCLLWHCAAFSNFRAYGQDARTPLRTM